uniref:Uncharacterized protein n=1 Tax=Oryza meridionalis TaxID=40149 RepID=A0A0E0CY15_9ORYZ
MARGTTDREDCKCRRPTLNSVDRLPVACRFPSSATLLPCGKKNNQQQCCWLRKEREKHVATIHAAAAAGRGCWSSKTAPSAMPVDCLLSPVLAASPTSSPSTASPSGAGHPAILLALPVVNRGWRLGSGEVVERRGGRREDLDGRKKHIKIDM